MKAYITQSNFSRILKNNKLNRWEQSYKYKWTILKFLSFKQLAYLDKHSIFLEELTKWKVNFFEKMEPQKDTFTKIFEWWIPAYHTNINCSKLHSDYKNYEVPLILLKRLQEDFNIWFNKVKDVSNFWKEFYNKWNLDLWNRNQNQENDIIAFIWENKVQEFRKWFNNNSSLLINDQDTFDEKMYLDWWVKWFDKKIEYDNSWIREFENYDGIEIENFIDNKIQERSIYIKTLTTQEIQIINFLWKNVYLFKDINIEIEEEKVWDIIKKFHKNFKWLKPDLEKLFDWYSYKEIYNLLINYDKNYIEVFKKVLSQYITIKLNPELKFETSVLESLGFKICLECSK